MDSFKCLEKIKIQKTLRPHDYKTYGSAGGKNKKGKRLTSGGNDAVLSDFIDFFPHFFYFRQT